MVELLELIKQWINNNNKTVNTDELMSSTINSRDIAYFNGEYLENQNSYKNIISTQNFPFFGG